MLTNNRLKAAKVFSHTKKHFLRNLKTNNCKTAISLSCDLASNIWQKKQTNYCFKYCTENCT